MRLATRTLSTSEAVLVQPIRPEVNRIPLTGDPREFKHPVGIQPLYEQDITIDVSHLGKALPLSNAQNRARITVRPVGTCLSEIMQHLIKPHALQLSLGTTIELTQSVPASRKGLV